MRIVTRRHFSHRDINESGNIIDLFDESHLGMMFNQRAENHI